ncbi:NAD(P)/FAD-dependent oxidoreductase [Arthrobacter sp. M4]|uniref:phytoene desaturase family protein n=1 Tax=Arthrobacter sp. M4 TaxID=218160 RepID=UPI001CDB5CBD|nr:NAD(P)/FAD-dependent oxidoreductase [Arthrobacter sp. M4]MCA4132509.1 NAD(P)/FAD-dependent oxidoreductase [Arthrobacter sp. M4]
MADYDAVFVGSGINTLTAAALLAQEGWRCAVFERQDHLGGAIHTTELVPGYTHDLYAISHAMFVGSAAYARLADDLAARGLKYLQCKVPSGGLTADGEAATLTTDPERNVAAFENAACGDGETWRRLRAEHLEVAHLVRGIMSGDLLSRQGIALGLRAYRQLGMKGLLKFSGELLETCRDWSDRFRSPITQALLAPWTLHAGMGPEQPSSGFMTRMMSMSLEARGTPVPEGGGHRLVDALAGIIRDAGGTCLTGTGVSTVLVERGRAAGVRLEDGTLVTAKRGVVAGVTPTQLYGSLLADVPEAHSAALAARRFRYGRARVQLQFALSDRPEWPDPQLLGAATIHVTSGVDAISRSVNEAERGLIPALPTLTVGQPAAVDPSRAPDGGWIFAVQLHEMPSRVRGDAAGQIDAAGGAWTEAVRERVADRAQEMLAKHIPNFESSIIRRVAMSPVDLTRANENFVGGDGSSGAFSLDQSLLWRPRPDLAGHTTPVRDLYLVGASTHPGPGLGAGSGIIVANRMGSGHRSWNRRRRTGVRS